MASGKCHHALEEFRSERPATRLAASSAAPIPAPPTPARHADLRNLIGWLAMAACAVGTVGLVEQLRTPPPLPTLISRAPSLLLPAPLPVVVPDRDIARQSRTQPDEWTSRSTPPRTRRMNPSGHQARRPAKPPHVASTPGGTQHESLPASETPLVAPLPASIPIPSRSLTSDATAAGQQSNALDRQAIWEVLNSYRQSYNRLDAASAAAIWRDVDTRALQRAFSALSSQHVTFHDCNLDIRDTQARALCRGAVSYVRRVGAPTARVQAMSWVIDIERSSGQWLIARVKAQ
jgi:hypothetical protein